MNGPKVGERWRVTPHSVEGVVSSVRGWNVTLDRGDEGGSYTLHQQTGEWERLPDPEPEYPPGSYVLAADGALWIRRTEGDDIGEFPWTKPGRETWEGWRDVNPLRPLIRLVPEVKP